MRRLLLLAAIVALAGCGSSPQSSSSATTSPSQSASPSGSSALNLPSNITCDGSTDVTGALQAAVNTSTMVVLSAGTCPISNHIAVARAVTISGEGATATFIVQHAAYNIFQISADGVTVENLNLDTATFNPGPPILKNPKPGVLFSNANNTTVMNVTGTAGSGFGMRFVGPNPCYSFQRGGTVLTNIDMTTTGTGGFASVDVDCQNHATLTNITIHGGILALFNDEFVTLTGETFTPGPNAMVCAPPWFVTGPAHDITINQVVSHGGHGVVANRAAGAAYNVTTTNQTVDGPGC